MSIYEGFEELASLVHVYTAPETAPTDSPIVILCTWMGASTKMIGRYIKAYISTIPNATIILITSNFNSVMSLSVSQWAKQVDGAIDIILSHRSKPIYACAYSNGGLQSLVQLALAYKARTKSTIDLKATVLDSAPGSPELTVAHRTFLLTSNPPSVAYYPVSVLVWLYLGGYWTVMTLRGIDTPVADSRNKINDTTLFRPGQRVYIYSKEDQLVPWQWVEANAESAEKKGWEVKKELFAGSKHVAHTVADKERYWQIVKGAVTARL
jgi:hypothetical protein